MTGRGAIIIRDVDPKTRDLVSAFLTYNGYDVASDDAEGPLSDAVARSGASIVISGSKWSAAGVAEFIAVFREISPFAVLVVYGSHEAVGSDDGVLHLPSPLNLDELESIVMRAMEYQTRKRQELAKRSARSDHPLSSFIIGRSRHVEHLFDMIEKVAESNSTVLIQGESGTGKELAARAIHQLSSRNKFNFIPVNCAAIPDDLLESELFGHVKGAFTGAYSNRAGRFEMADKGTLFLDEIGDMKANLQVKLLRVLQTREIEPVGATRSQKVDVRIIAATNKNLDEMVETKDFREDLYYRLSVIPLVIPPLRERNEDIPLLIDNFLTRYNIDRKHSVKGFSPEALDILCSYQWPGNIRELENLVERMVILKDKGFILPDDLPERYSGGALRVPVSFVPPVPATEKFPEEGVCLNSAVDAFENNLIMQALEKTGGNKKEAARLLNLKRTTLIEKLKKKNLASVPARGDQ